MIELKRIISLLVVYLACSVFHELKGQPTLVWENHFDFQSNDDYPVKLLVDSSGQCFISGISFNINTEEDITAFALDNSGYLSWHQSIINDHTDRINDMKVDIKSNMYLTGSLGDIFLTKPGFTLKYDSGGNLKWVDTVGRVGRAIVIDDSMNIYVVYQDEAILLIKYSSTHVKFFEVRNDTFIAGNTVEPTLVAVDECRNIYVAGHIGGSNLDSEYFIKKFKANGEFEWDVRYNPAPGQDYAHYLLIDDSANIYLLGDIDGGTHAHGIALVKYDSSGNFLWDKQILYYPSDPFGLVLDSANAPVICGFISDNSLLKYFVRKYSPQGQELWTKYIDTACWPQPFSAITSDKIGGVYFTGALKGTNANLSDIYLDKFNSDGDKQWETMYNSSNNGFDVPIGIALNKGLDIYVTAKSFDSITSSDILTLKYSQPTGVISPFSSYHKVLEINPNPFHSETSVQIFGTMPNEGPVLLEWIDMSGRLLRKDELHGQESFTINREGIANGMYLLKIISNQTIATTKIVIQ